MEVGEGFEALGAVLWTTLSHCQSENDIHTASVIMMLSQVCLVLVLVLSLVSQVSVISSCALFLM